MRYLLPALLVCLLAACATPTSSPLVEDGSDITLQKNAADELKKSEADTFRVELTGNAFISGYANQLTADVEIHILNPAKKETNSYDDSGRGHDNFFFMANEAGTWYIVIKPYEANEGKYELHLTGAETLGADPTKRADQIAKAMIPAGGPGASVAVTQNDRVIYSKGFGLANLEYNIPNTPQTIFHVASVSKQFTGFAIALLADQGKLNVNDDVRKYIPELHDFGTPITLSHLVHHTSGLRDQWNLLAMAGWRLDDVITHNQIMRLVAKQRELNFAPGEEMLYCNTGFTLLAEVVHCVTGQSFADWSRENIFAPLEMNNTFFYDDHEKMVPNRAYSYYRNDTIYKKSVLSYANVGATSLFTTVEDLSKWATNFRQMKVGNERVMQRMQEPFVLNKGDTTKYGYGIGMGTYKGLRTLSHGGADAGYRTMLLMFPDQQLSIAVFSNLASFSPGGLSYAIADAFLESEYKPEPPKETPAPSPPEATTEKKPEAEPGEKLSAYEGRYYSEELETFYTLETKGDTLIARHQRHDDMKMWRKSGNVFSTNTWWMGEVTFTQQQGKISGMKASNGRVRNLRFDKVN